MRVPVTPQRVDVRVPWIPWQPGVRVPVAHGSSPPLQLHLGESGELHSLSRQQRKVFFWSKPWVFSCFSQTLMNAPCMGLAARHAATQRAPTHAAVSRGISCSQTTDPAKPRTVRALAGAVQCFGTALQIMTLPWALPGVTAMGLRCALTPLSPPCPQSPWIALLCCSLPTPRTFWPRT